MRIPQIGRRRAKRLGYITLGRRRAFISEDPHIIHTSAQATRYEAAGSGDFGGFFSR